MTGPLRNEKHERFAQEVAKGEGQFAAYRKVGYRGDEAHASRLAAREDVRSRIESILSRAAARAEVTIEKVLNELAMIGFANMQDYMRVGADGDPHLDFSALSREQAAALTEVTVEDFKDGRGPGARDVRRVKFKLADKRAALVDIGRHLGMFKDRVSHENPDGSAINPVVIFKLPDNER